MLKYIALILIAVLYNSVVYAAINCNAYPPVLDDTIQLSGSYYIGQELPIGTVIYKTRITESSRTGISCDAAFNVPRMLTVTNEPSGTSFSQSGIPFSGNVYPTNIPGISAALSWNTQTFTKNTPLNAGGIYFGNNAAGGVGNFQGVITLSLIKTGNITPGSVVQGTALPTAIVYAGNTNSYSGIAGYTGLPVTVHTFRFVGSITFTGGTCQTPSYNVEMGSYAIKDYFSTPGSTTPWVDASINLTGCPVFTGFHSDNTFQNVTGSGTPSGTSVNNNSVSVNVVPSNGFLVATDGIFALSTSGNGPSASGVGLQLGYSLLPNTSAIPPQYSWKNNKWSVGFPANAYGNITLPLAVRYYQTGTTVTPGKANGMVTYTIDYN